MRGPTAQRVAEQAGTTGYVPGQPRGSPIVNRVMVARMNDPAPSMASILEAFRCWPVRGGVAPSPFQASALLEAKTKGSSRTDFDYYGGVD